jgi:predicted PurR-regulated permease PerM
VTSEVGGPGPDDRQIAVDKALAYLLLGVLLYSAYLMFQPILPAILWGFMLAIVTAHPFERLTSALGGRRSLAVGIFAVLFLVLLLAPVGLLASELLAQVPRLAEQAKRLSEGPLPPLPEGLASIRGIGPYLVETWEGRGAEVVTQLLSNLSGLGAWLLARVGEIGTFLFEFSIGGISALFLLLYRFRVRAFLARLLQRLGGDFAQGMVLHAFDATRAAFTGVMAAAIAQTVLATVAVGVAGLPGLWFFAALTFVLAIIQVGPLVIGLVAVVMLLIEGAYLPALLIGLWFGVVVTSVDNLVKPMFTGRGDNMPNFLTFLGSIGGLIAFGLIGVFVGPVLTSVLYRLLEAWMTPPAAAGEA